MNLALEQANLSGEDVPVGCVIVVDSEIISAGHNERESTGDPTAHAEIVAIRAAAKKLGTWRLAGATLYTTLEPCPMCAEAIIQSRLSKVIFGAYDNVSGALGSKFNLFCAGRIYPIPEVLGGVEEASCRKILVDYFANRTHR
ncbi:tRNA adenosine(34) deaminase TadA [soil metagenome]